MGRSIADISDLASVRSKGTTTGMGQGFRRECWSWHWLGSGGSPHHSCLPVTPFVWMISSAALATALFRDSLPTLFILLEFRARFCLVVPKASMQESICQETESIIETTRMHSTSRRRGSLHHSLSALRYLGSTARNKYYSQTTSAAFTNKSAESTLGKRKG